MEQLQHDLIEIAEYLYREKRRLEEAIPGELPLDRERSEKKLIPITQALDNISKALDNISYYRSLP